MHYDFFLSPTCPRITNMAKIKLTDPYIRSLQATGSRTEVYDEIVNGLAVRVTDKGTKTFVFRYYYNGTAKRLTIGRFPEMALADARKLCKQHHATVVMGNDPHGLKQLSKRRIRTQERFKDVAKRYQAEHLPMLRDSTAIVYNHIIEKELLKPLGSIPIAEIDKKTVIQLLDKIAVTRNKKVLANRVKATLSSIFTFAVDKAILDHNIIRLVRKYSKSKNGERVEVKRDRYYTPDEIQRLWSAFDVQQEPIRSYFVFLLLTGQRRGETAKASWEHIDLDQRTWVIPASNTKNKRKHTIPLSSGAVEVLRHLKTINRHGTWVFESRYTDTPINWTDKAKQRIIKLSGVKDFRPHDLRRTLATNLTDLGTSTTVLKRILNHVEQDVTDIYDRNDYWLPMMEALEKWSNRIDDILSGKTANVTEIKQAGNN